MIKKTNFKDLFLLKNNPYKDKRGYFKELIKENKIKHNFPFFVMSYSNACVFYYFCLFYNYYFILFTF